MLGFVLGKFVLLLLLFFFCNCFACLAIQFACLLSLGGDYEESRDLGEKFRVKFEN